MLRLGTIGTSWITAQFIEAALATKEYELTTIYSRQADKAQAWQAKYHAQAYFTDLKTFFEQGQFDVVYISSPNSLHFEQTRQAILAGKDVIVEKPAFANPMQQQVIKKLLTDHPDRFVIEAARHVYEPNFTHIKTAITQLDDLQGATLTYMKYSSRYDKVLAGETPNIFNPVFAGGAAQDLGVYVVYDAVAWFGQPDRVAYFAAPTPTGVDGRGTAILSYPDFDVTLIFGKNATSYLPTEIYGLHETLVITPNAADIAKIEKHQVGVATVTQLGEPAAANPMLHEAQAFAKMIQTGDHDFAQQQFQLSTQVNSVLYQLRRSAGLHFPADSVSEGNYAE